MKKAVTNSLAKKYHGSIDEVYGLPSNGDQIKVLRKKTETTQQFVKDGKIVDASESVWKERCVNRWNWIGHFMHIDP